MWRILNCVITSFKLCVQCTSTMANLYKACVSKQSIAPSRHILYYIFMGHILTHENQNCFDRYRQKRISLAYLVFWKHSISKLWRTKMAWWRKLVNCLLHKYTEYTISLPNTKSRQIKFQIKVQPIECQLYYFIFNSQFVYTHSFGRLIFFNYCPHCIHLMPMHIYSQIKINLIKSHEIEH